MSLINTISLPITNTNQELTQISFDGTYAWTVAHIGSYLYQIPLSNPQSFNSIDLAPLLGANNSAEGVASDGTNVWITCLTDQPQIIRCSCSNTLDIVNIPLSGISSSYLIRTVCVDSTNVWFTITTYSSITSYVGYFPQNTTSSPITPTLITITSPSFSDYFLGGISSDDTYVWVANSEQTDKSSCNELFQIDISSQTQINTITVGNGPTGVSSDGTYVWVSNYDDLTVSQIQCNNTSIINTINVTGAPYGISSNGTYVIVACSTNNNNNITILNAQNGSLVNRINTSQQPYYVSCKENYAWVNAGKNTVYELSLTSYTTPNIYTYNGISVIPPTGSIIAFLGTVDPNGWVIMDGLPRVNTGQYNNLLLMNIGTGTAWISGAGVPYTPPDYQGAFLRGIGGTSPYIGPSLINNSQTDQTALLNHNHVINISDPGHAHQQNRVGADNYPCGNGGATTAGLGDPNNPSLFTYTYVSTTGITASSNDASIVQETRPYNYGVNWILKL